ncbi:MAG: hypothetical protein AB7I19_09605 [Planctomycetota bacterium]
MNARRPPRRRSLGCIFASALLAGGCLNFRYDRTRVNEPIDAAASDALTIGSATLADVLDHLGAPAIVWPSLDGEVVMAYAWADSAALGLQLSFAFHRLTPAARVSWDDGQDDVPAVLLRLDGNLVLREIRRGVLRDIAPELPDATAADNTALDVVRTYR